MTKVQVWKIHLRDVQREITTEIFEHPFIEYFPTRQEAEARMSQLRAERIADLEEQLATLRSYLA